MVGLKTVVAIGTLVTVGVLTAMPAYAQSTYVGKVTANGGLLVRHLPTATSATEGRLNNGQQIEIICKVRGSSVNGNDSWYSLPPTLNEWVSARYVQNIGSAPRWCGSTQRYVGQTTAAVKKRAAPTTASAQVSLVANGAGVDIICKLEGQTVSGNNLWYFSTDHRWVAARYVRNVGRAPGWCNASAQKEPSKQQFRMRIEEISSIRGRGTLVTGPIEQGAVSAGDSVEIVRPGAKPIASVVNAVIVSGKIIKRGRAGDTVGVLLRAVNSNQVTRGQVLRAT